MDQLMKPCLDFDDDNDEEENESCSLNLDGLRPTLNENADKNEGS